MAYTFFVNNGPITDRLRHHDAGYRPEAEARHRRGRAAAQRERRRVRGVADRVAPAREDAGVRGRRHVHAEARRVRRGGVLGKGKREELRLMREQDAVDVILVDHEISPSQAHTLEMEVGCEVMDRTMVILEIFHRHASSRYARAQVEIARLGYMAPRMREAAKEAGPKDRGRSGTGGRSGGESHGELDRRKIRDRIAELQKELDGMGLEHKTQRARRQEREGLARVALVGYTNAGKSTLMRALTGSEALVADK